MAIFTVDLNIQESCPDLIFTDNTDYAGSGHFPYSDFKFHDYGGGALANNTTFTYNAFVFGTLDLSSISIDIDTNGVGDILNPEIQYTALVDAINGLEDLVSAVLVKPVNSDFEDWYVRIYAYNASEAGGATSVTAPGATPVFATISTPVVPVTARNLTVYDSRGNVIDLGAEAQVDTLTLDVGTYTVSETFTITFCETDLVYTVVDTGAVCIAKEIAELVNSQTDNKFSSYVAATYTANSVIFTATEAGVPLDISVVYSGAESITFVTITDNVPSMSIPQYQISDAITHTAIERGGTYTAYLTSVSECDYNVGIGTILSWCYDLEQFDCCFISLLTTETCCSKRKSLKDSASYLQAIIRGVTLSKDNNCKESATQRIVDLGWSICEPLNCGCTTC